MPGVPLPGAVQVMRLYVVLGVPEDTVFETRTKKEIGEIAWHKIKELPTSKDVQGKAKPFWYVGMRVESLGAGAAQARRRRGGLRVDTSAHASNLGI